MKDEDYKKLNKLRVKMSSNAFRAQVLFKTILNYEINAEYQPCRN